jgi:hypothetical protein
MAARPDLKSHQEEIMGIFSNMVSTIFGSKAADSAAAAGKPAAFADLSGAPTGAAPTSSAGTSAPGTAARTSAAPPTSSGGTAAPATATPTGKPMTRAELESHIARLEDDQAEDLNWRESIVDLMKLLKLDSSLGARKELAQELGYTGPLTGSAEMNIWLHKQVMTKLAEGGGKVPDSLKT